jgi:hypothetical protein
MSGFSALAVKSRICLASPRAAAASRPVYRDISVGDGGTCASNPEAEPVMKKTPSDKLAIRYNRFIAGRGGNR